MFTAKHCADHEPPEWPRAMNVSLDRLDAAQKAADAGDGSDQRMLRDYWNAVLATESVAAGSLATLYRAWRELLNLGGPEYEPLARAIRQHLATKWNLRLAAPPHHDAIAEVACRSTRRFDLLPPYARDW